jgi:predicted TIM-barrel fold metal-dependent hydrolase
MLRRIKNDACYEALVHAYNEYLIEEYAAVAPDRLITMGVIPTSGIDAAMRELEYCARAAFKGVLIDKFPSGKGYPTAADDRFWAASVEMDIPVSSHTAGGSTRMLSRDEPTFEFPKIPVEGTDPLRQLFRFCGDAAFAPVQMAFAGVWDRFPKLKIYWAETMIGWLPYALWQIDDHYERYQYLAKFHWGLDWLERPPSDYIKQHCLWGFLSDPVGIQMRQAARTENLLWGSDFAHAASDWPHSRQLIERDFAGVPEDERYQMIAGNAIRYFHLDAE